MKKIKNGILFFAFSFTLFSWSQEVVILGRVSGNSDVENIHVINRTSKKFTTTNSVGAFQITAKLNDTIQFSAIKYKSKEIIVTLKNLSSKILVITLEELLNVLDEVVVGKILTGDLNSDINNSDTERTVDFYDLGISGNTNKPKTQSERRLNEAITGSGIIPLNPIINALTGRTKMLKQRIRFEKNNNLINSIKDRLSNEFFEVYDLPEDNRMDFLYYCSEDENFQARCKNKSDIEILIFLQEKIIVYKQNLLEIKN